MKRTIALIILDGWGFGKTDESNPIHSAHLKTIQFIEKNFPFGALQASGISIGMPWDEEGNSEVGHMTIGAGRVFYQHYPKITLAIENGSFFQNEALLGAFTHAKKNKSAVHLIGLIGDGVVHSAFPHLLALISMAREEKFENVFIHAITDGRDSAPRSARIHIQRLMEEIKKGGIGTITTLIGRYYAMDRDKHWERTKKAYDLLTSPEKEKIRTLEESVETAYAKGLNDEYIEPTVIGTPHPIQEGDSIILFNFREDRMRQITEAIISEKFSEFETKKLKNIYVATMTEYKEGLPVHVAFMREEISLPLGKVIADAGKTQLRIAETEKYAHVTYFFNGLKEKPYPNEYRILIPSKNTTHYENNPEMMASAITDRAVSALNEGVFDFILVNYANPDMVAHTGNFDATVKAVQVVDAQIERLLKVALEHEHILLITSDHGNAEEVINAQTGEVETKHDTNPVPFYLVGREFYSENRSPRHSRPPVIGLISDVAPTVLALMGIEKPKEMTGQNLLEQLV